MSESTNKLYYGDNLQIMEREMKKWSVDLIYLDPPFKSQQNYNLIYRTLTGKPVPEQAEAFCDTWEMDAEKQKLADRMPVLMREYGVDDYYADFWKLWVKALRHTQPHLLAYLIYMVRRLLHMKVILKPTGSLYLHCDPEASHYIKVMMDGIFGHENFRSEIIWKRSSAHSDTKQGRKVHGHIHDVILFYTMGNDWTWNPVYTEYEDEYFSTAYRHETEDGRLYKETDATAARPGGDTEYEWRVKREKDAGTRWVADLNEEYLEPKEGWEYKGVPPYSGRYWAYSRENLEQFWKDGRLIHRSTGMPRIMQFAEEMPGVPLQDVWTDIPPIGAKADERLGYPTQKPIKLLRRIIECSSNPGDVVFDPFCGCGTTIYAAQETGRRWIGCDVAILAVRLVEDQLDSRYGLKKGEHYVEEGIPNSVASARALWNRDHTQFEHWVVEHIGGFPTKASGDRGVDGRIYFETDEDPLGVMALSVKGGEHVGPKDVRDLIGAVSNESRAKLGGFICFREPTRGMKDAVAKAGVWTYRGVDYDRIQILTVQQILEDKKKFQTPTRVRTRAQSDQTRLAM